MDLSSMSSTRYAERAFQPQFYQQPHYSAPGVSPDQPGASPLPGSTWGSDKMVWVAQDQEKASLEKIHVSEAGQRMLGRMAGLWELQTGVVRRFQDEQNSSERAAISSQFMTRNAINALEAVKSRFTVAGGTVDIYA